MNESAPLRCYRCGEGLEQLSLPIARLDLCPACSVELHVCRMCGNFDASVPAACTEEDAEEVHEKARANFCEFFSPSAAAFNGAEKRAEDESRARLSALFGEPGLESDVDNNPDPLADARALFDD